MKDKERLNKGLSQTGGDQRDTTITTWDLDWMLEQKKGQQCRKPGEIKIRFVI